MAARKRKKNTRQRGSCTHGWGSMKKHRGKGNKGGAGMAGTGKKGDAKNPSVWKEKYFGKYGFKKKGLKKKINAINIDELDKLADKKEGDVYILDLKSVGYNKLLGKGILKNKFKVTVDSASEKAVQKIQDKGGEVITKKEE